MRVSRKSFTDRLREPSTWTALGALGAVFGVRELEQLGAPETATAVAQVGSFLAMLLGVFIAEKKMKASTIALASLILSLQGALLGVAVHIEHRLTRLETLTRALASSPAPHGPARRHDTLEGL